MCIRDSFYATKKIVGSEINYEVLGVPIRVIVSPRNLKEGVCEVVTRDKTVNMKVEIDKVIDTVKAMIAERLA